MISPRPHSPFVTQLWTLIPLLTQRDDASHYDVLMTAAHLILEDVSCWEFLGRRFEQCGLFDCGPESNVRNCEQEALGNVREEGQSL